MVYVTPHVFNPQGYANPMFKILVYSAHKFLKIQWSNHTIEEATWKVRISFVLTIQILSYRSEGTCDYSLSL
jgi:hypothetical protein